MAQVRRMEIEVIWAARACLEQRDRRPPMIAVLVPCRERMEGRERREVIGRDRCGARPPREIADQLRPIGSFQRRAFAGGDHARIGQRSEEHTSELQSLMRNSYAVSCLKKKQS